MIDVFGPDIREGDCIGVSNWRYVSQQSIDRFAEATDDFQFFHVDPIRAARETPFQGTIAHGFLTLSLISTLATDALPAPAALKSAIIVGVDRVRFSAPVPAGRRICGRFYFKRSNRLAEDTVLLRVTARIDIEGGDRPVLSGEFSWLCTLHPRAEVRAPAELVAAT